MKIIILIVLVIFGLTAVACTSEAPSPADTQTASLPTSDVPATVEAGVIATGEAETAIDATVEAKVAATLTTSTPSPTPMLTATPRPTNTPWPTSTPGQTNTPRPTATPYPTAVPQPTPTPTPTVTPTPEPTATPTPDPRITEMSLAVEARRPDRSVGFYLTTATLIERGRLRIEEALTLAVLVQCEAGTLSGWTAQQHQAERPAYVAGRSAPCFAETDTVTWVSSDESVATVNREYMDHFATRSGGIVRAVGTGAASVTAYFNGHSTSLDLDVVPGVDIGERANGDRPDDRDGKQIHFVYAVPIGDENLEYDRDGDIALIATWMQDWLRERTGMTWRFDTHGGEIDVSFLPIRFAASDLDDLDTHLGDIIPQFRDALEAREEGQLDPEKKYAIFFHYDGAEGVFGPDGIAGQQINVTLIHGPFHELFAATAIHELLHTFGAVPDCAPHSTPGHHVNDSDLDILGGGGYVDGVLDWGNDDYFRHDNAGCLDIEDSPYWVME